MNTSREKEIRRPNNQIKHRATRESRPNIRMLAAHLASLENADKILECLRLAAEMRVQKREDGDQKPGVFAAEVISAADKAKLDKKRD